MNDPEMLATLQVILLRENYRPWRFFWWQGRENMGLYFRHLWAVSNLALPPCHHLLWDWTFWNFLVSGHLLFIHHWPWRCEVCHQWGRYSGGTRGRQDPHHHVRWGGLEAHLIIVRHGEEALLELTVWYKCRLLGQSLFWIDCSVMYYLQIVINVDL